MDMFFEQIICNGHFVQKLICSQVFSSYEKWEFFDALYYCFATLTTIGSYLPFQRSTNLLFEDELSCFSKITYITFQRSPITCFSKIVFSLFKDKLSRFSKITFFAFQPFSIGFCRLNQLFLSRIWGLGGSSTRQLVAKET